VVLTSKLIDGRFPDYERVIPVDNDKRLEVDTKLFAQAVDRVSTVSSEKGRAVKFAISVPVYNYDTSSVQIMQLVQKSLINELDSVSQMEDYADLLAWDFVLGKEGVGLETRYSLRPAPRKKGAQADIETAWTESRDSGFDISRLLTGDNPFKEG
jgi:hypothetical protein